MPERLKHSVDGAGDHHIELVLRSDEVNDDRPRVDLDICHTYLQLVQQVEHSKAWQPPAEALMA